MAKKNVTQTEGEEPSQPVVDKAAEKAAKKAATEAKRNGDKFVFIVSKIEGKKLAPQAQGIVDLLEKAGEAGLTRAQLVDAMKGTITTRQPEGRILSYYQKTLVDGGFIRIDAAA